MVSIEPLDTMELREVEKAKIHCAEEHFKAICPGEVVYKMINGYDQLLNEVMQ